MFPLDPHAGKDIWDNVRTPERLGVSLRTTGPVLDVHVKPIVALPGPGEMGVMLIEFMMLPDALNQVTFGGGFDACRITE